MKHYRLAIVCGVGLVLYHLALEQAMGDINSLSYEQWQRFELYGALRYVVIIVCVLLSVWMYSRSYNANTSFKRLFVVGTVAATILAHCIGIYEFIYMYWHPGFVDAYMKAQQAHASGLSEGGIVLQQTAPKNEMVEFMKNPLINGIFYFVETLLLGLITAALSALTLKRRGVAPAESDT